VKQTDYGIRPYRGGPAGTVRVADRVTFSFEAVGIRSTGPRKNQTRADNSPGWRSGEVAVTLRRDPCAMLYLIRLGRWDVSLPPPPGVRLHPVGCPPPGNRCTHSYHRLTLPMRDRVIFSTRAPRRRTTLVFDHPIPGRSR